MSYPLSSNITISGEILSQEVGNETVLLDLLSESYFGLDSVGTRFWQLLQDQSSLKKVYDTLLSEYDVDGKQLANDLDELLVELADKELISIHQA